MLFGLFVSHARNISFRNFRFETIEPDTRHAILLMDVENISFENVTGIEDTVIVKEEKVAFQ